MNPFDVIDVTEDREFFLTDTDEILSVEEIEEYYQAGIEFTKNAMIELKKQFGDFIK
tara:strand:- start:724 stop:894 length:171 start_codon:yes stop_codon:yes gene_type:complete